MEMEKMKFLMKLFCILIITSISSMVLLKTSGNWQNSEHYMCDVAIPIMPCKCSSSFVYTSPCEYIKQNSQKPRFGGPVTNLLEVLTPHCGPEYCKTVPEAFKQALTVDQIQEFLKLMENFTKTMNKFGLFYIMSGGTLLGSVRHHGFIPWDDDVDVIVNYTEKENILKAMNTLKPDYQIKQWRDTNWKFYRTKAHKISKSKHLKNLKWPFVDIFFFKENATHISLHFHASKSTDTYFLKTDIFPTKKRPFCNLWLQAPNNIEGFFGSQFPGFDPNQCVSRTFSHRYQTLVKTNMQKESEKPITSMCSHLAYYYPFVTRRCLHENKTLELLAMGGLEFQELSIQN